MRHTIDENTLLERVDELERKVKKLVKAKDETLYFNDYVSAKKFVDKNKIKDYELKELNVSSAKGKKRFCLVYRNK